jgi:hypothetical protein
MPTLPKEILQESLKDRRLGILVRVALTHQTREKIRRLKEESRRNFHDIFRVLLAIYKRNKDVLNFEAEGERTKILSVRLGRRDFLDANNWAWMRLEDRKYFLGALAEVFFARVPFNFALKIFREQVDRLYRAVEEVQCSNWTNFRKGLIQMTSTRGSSGACRAPRPSPSGKRKEKAK